MMEKHANTHKIDFVTILVEKNTKILKNTSNPSKFRKSTNICDFFEDFGNFDGFDTIFSEITRFFDQNEPKSWFRRQFDGF